MAITLIPMAIIPQIILSGTISPLEGWSKALALVGISTYWGKRGLDACLPETVAQGGARRPGPALDRYRRAGLAGSRPRGSSVGTGDAALAESPRTVVGSCCPRRAVIPRLH